MQSANKAPHKTKKSKPPQKPTPKAEPKLVVASKWRLKRTVSRKLDFRPIELDDVKYAWAAYRAGALGSMREDWKEPKLTAAEFKDAFGREVISNYSSCWVLFANTPKGFLPVGFVLAFFSHPNPLLAPFQIIGDMVWFPWASRRNKVESAVNFFAKVRKEYPLTEYARGGVAKRFFEVMCQHGVMRRVGTTFNVFHGEPVAVFETRQT